MATDAKVASAPDVLTRTLPALNATSDMPGATPPVVVNNPATSASGEKPATTTEPVVVTPDPKADATKTDGADGKKADATVDATKTADAADAKKKDGINERFSKLTADRKAAEERAALEETNRKAAEARADALADDVRKLTQSVEKLIPKAPEDVRPERAKFDDPNKYDEALAQWSFRQGEIKAKAEAEAGFKQKTDAEHQAAADAARKTAQDKIAADWKTRSEAFTKDHADFDEVIKRDDVLITPTMGTAMMMSDHGPQIAYHLAQNPEEAAKIAAMPDAHQLMALGRLEAKLSVPPKTTETPDPINPLGTGRNAAAATKSANEESMSEYASRRQQELAAARSNGRAAKS